VSRWVRENAAQDHRGCGTPYHPCLPMTSPLPFHRHDHVHGGDYDRDHDHGGGGGDVRREKP